jgi:hypothetical protein
MKSEDTDATGIAEEKYNFLRSANEAWATAFGIAVVLLGLFCLAGYGCQQCEQTQRNAADNIIELERLRAEKGMVPVTLPGSSEVHWSADPGKIPGVQLPTEKTD